MGDKQEPKTKNQQVDDLWSQVYARQRQIRLYVKEIELLMLTIAGLDVEIDEPATDQSAGGSE